MGHLRNSAKLASDGFGLDLRMKEAFSAMGYYDPESKGPSLTNPLLVLMFTWRDAGDCTAKVVNQSAPAKAEAENRPRPENEFGAAPLSHLSPSSPVSCATGSS